MKVLQFPSYITIKGYEEFSRNITGFGYMSIDIATSVAKADVDVDLITNGNITKGLRYQNLNILKRTWWDILSNLKFSNLKNALKAFINDKPLFEKFPNYLLYYISMGYFEKVLTKKSYNLVHIHSIGPDTLPIISTCEKCNVKYLVTLHGLNSFSDSVKIGEKHRQIEKDFLKRAEDKNIPVTVISTGIRQTILNYLNISDSRNFIVVTNGCDITKMDNISDINIRIKYDIPKDKLIALCVGNIVVRKNQAQVVRAYSLLNENIKSKLVILFLGSDVTKDEFENVVKESGNCQNLIRCGNIPKAEVDVYFSQANYNIVASISEGFGLSMIEGFKCGVPTLTFSDLDAVPDLFHEKAMLLVHQRTDEALANGIQKMVSVVWDKNFIQEYSRNFSLEHMAKDYIKVYKKIVDE